MSDSPAPPPPRGRRFAWSEAGNWRASLKADKDLMAESRWRALRKEGDALKALVRDNVKSSGMRNAVRLSKAWRGQIFPRSANAHAKRPAYVFGNQAPNVLDTFETGADIRAAGPSLLIPIGRARRIKLRIGQARNAANLVAAALAMFGASRLTSQRMKRTGEVALGVISALEGGREKFIPLFILRRHVTAPKLLDAKKIIARWEAGAADRVAAEAQRLFDAQRDARQAQAARASPGLLQSAAR